jgi:hypothetical protein
MRPGRFDVHVRSTCARRDEAAAIRRHFYTPSPGVTESVPGDEDAEVVCSKSDLAAEKFADTVIQDSVDITIAAIQGFFLLYKRDPDMAQEKVGEWVRELRRKQRLERASAW